MGRGMGRGPCRKHHPQPPPVSKKSMTYPRRVRVRPVEPGPDGSPRRLEVRFPYDEELVRRIRRVPGRRWVPERKVWLVPDDAATRKLLARLFGDRPSRDPDAAPGADAALDSRRTTLLERMEAELRLHGYAARTRKVYLGHARRFLEKVDNPAEPPAEEGIRAHLLHLLGERKLSHSYVNQRISAIKFLYRRVLDREAPTASLPRPRRRRKLPTVLARSEVRALLDAVTNPKHRAILMLAYGAGLRVGEVVRLRPEDLDEARGMLRVRQAKGRNPEGRHTPHAPPHLRHPPARERHRPPLHSGAAGARRAQDDPDLHASDRAGPRSDPKPAGRAGWGIVTGPPGALTLSPKAPSLEA